jgi:hypothetical protein
LLDPPRNDEGCLDIMPSNHLAVTRSLHDVVRHFYPLQDINFSVVVCRARGDMPEPVNVVLDILTVSSGEAFERTCCPLGYW